MTGKQSCRLPSGGMIDRSRPLHFQFDGRDFEGHAGDTLASALLANGVKVAGRSFKYHRPRGLFGAGVDEPNVLVQLGGDTGTTNLRATEIELFEGLKARAVNCWPNARFDVNAVNGLLTRFLPAGFYYKTFLWPSWKLFEPIIRRAAGLGWVPERCDTTEYDTRYAHCDVLVVGSGPAGLAAARAAGSSGARVILCEQDALLGGSLLYTDAEIDGLAGPAWVERVQGELESYGETQVLTRTAAVGYFDHNTVVLHEKRLGRNESVDHRLWEVRAKRVVLACGSLERPIAFAGNDRPGVMLTSAVRQYVRRFGVLAGKRAVIFTNNNSAYELAKVLTAAGGIVSAIVDTRKTVPGGLADFVRTTGAEIFQGAAIAGTRGRHGLTQVTVRDGTGSTCRIAADLLAVSGGENPNVQMFCQSGGKLIYDEVLAHFRPGTTVQAEVSVGAANGTFDPATTLREGHDAGANAAVLTGFEPQARAPAGCTQDPAYAIEACWHVPGKGKAFVDFQNDVAVSDIALAQRENFQSVEHLKRYTTLGMGTDQGKTSNVVGLAVMGELTGRSPQKAGTTTFRFPYTPVPLAAFAGRARGTLYRPLRQMPAHDWHAANGAVFEEYGGWRRPAHYLRPGENAAKAEQREAIIVRERVGLFEASPLGKIEVKGPDAAGFLDRIYANTMSTLKVGNARYGLMLSEQGAIIDDGIAARLAEDCFLVGTTSGGAGRIAQWLEEWLQCEWIELDVVAAPVTTAWGTITLAGPRARDVLNAVGTDIPLAASEFPHMSFRVGTVAGIPARVFRVSFTGELSFEVNVPASRTQELWQAMMHAGRVFDIEPVGVDAWMLLRTEKGYMHIGVDTDGTTLPGDVGWGHVLKRGGDFVGRRSLSRPDAKRGDRLQFVGLESVSGSALPIGAHILTKDGASDGYVTSSGYSPALKQSVALGMVRAGRARLGEEIALAFQGDRHKARIVTPGAYDPEGKRLNV